MKQEIKAFNAEVKVSSSGDKGIVEALVSVFGNVDLGGDRVLEGAFSESLAKWKAKGDPMPFIFSHQWDNPDAYLGAVTEAEETQDGLVVKAQIDLGHPAAKRVFDLLKQRLITQFSFGFYAEEFSYVKDEVYGEVRELSKVDVFEVGPTLMGMNPETALLEAASAVTRSQKAGRVLNSKNEQALRDARDLIDSVLSGVSTESAKSDGQSDSSGYVDTTPDEKSALGGADGDTLTHDPCPEPAQPASEVIATDDAVADNPSSVGEDGKAFGDPESIINDEQIVALLAKTRFGEES